MAKTPPPKPSSPSYQSPMVPAHKRMAAGGKGNTLGGKK